MIKLTKHLLLSVLLVFSSTVLYAQAAAPDPVAMLQDVSKKLFAELERNESQLSSSSSVVYNIVSRTLIPAVDLNRASGLVVGRHYWLEATPAQRQEFVRQFTKRVISTYASAFASYNGDRIQFSPLRGGAGNQRTVRVRSVLIRPNGQRIPIDYNLVLQNNCWKIYDFSIENVSLVQSYRSQFSSALAQGGLPGLTKQLAARNR